jgi:hypothetical protein
MDFSKLINTTITIRMQKTFKGLLRQNNLSIVNRVPNGKILLNSIIRYLPVGETAEPILYHKHMTFINTIQKSHGRMVGSIQ